MSGLKVFGNPPGEFPLIEGRLVRTDAKRLYRTVHLPRHRRNNDAGVYAAG
jgi:hypothetical protein